MASENDKYLTQQLITYIGNKRKLLRFIDCGIKRVLKRLNKKKLNVLDGFSGSGIISRFLKKYADTLYSNDLEYYCYIINKCYLSNKSEIDFDIINNNIIFLNRAKLLNNKIGIIQKLYSPKDDNNVKLGERVFYTNKNAKIIDNVRKNINKLDDKHFYIAPLLSEASIHTNTSGVFKGFYKNSKTSIGQFGGNAENCLNRITGEIILPAPLFSNFECDYKIYNKDINKLVKKIDSLDLAYYDPPYNQHPYGSNYFMLNIIAKYKKPINLSKVSGIPKNWNKSKYNKKNEVLFSFEELIKNTNAKIILISYNNEGFVSYDEFKKMAKKYGKVGVKYHKYDTFKASRNLYGRSKKVNEMLIIIERK
jgi:adenine-specific DNA-methyltransferase